MGERDFEAVNKLAMDQISTLEKGDTKNIVPQLSTSPGDFWKSDYSRPAWRPSSQSETTRVPLLGSTPRSYYTSRDVGGYYNPDSYYRKTLNAIYRQERAGGDEDASKEKEMVVTVINRDNSKTSLGGSLFTEYFETSSEPEPIINQNENGETIQYEVKPKQMVIPKISAETRNQMLAIILSGFTRVASTMVLNWAKERKVPYELL